MLSSIVVIIVLLLIKISLCKNFVYGILLLLLFEWIRSGLVHWYSRYRSVLACELYEFTHRWLFNRFVFLFMNLCRDLTATTTATTAAVSAVMVMISLSCVRALFNLYRVSKKYQNEAYKHIHLYWLEHTACLRDRAGESERQTWLNWIHTIAYTVHTHVVDAKHANGNVTIAVNNNSKTEHTYVHIHPL